MTRGDRLRWLLDHPELWEAWPQSRIDYRPEHWAREKVLTKAMRAAGLYSPRTYLRDINVVNLIKDARAHGGGSMQTSAVSKLAGPPWPKVYAGTPRRTYWLASGWKRGVDG